MTPKEFAKMYGLKINVISSAHSAGQSNYNLDLNAPNGKLIYVDRFTFAKQSPRGIFDHDQAMHDLLDYIMQCADNAEYADEFKRDADDLPVDWSDFDYKSFKVVQDFQEMVGIIGYEEFLFACKTEGDHNVPTL